MVRLIAIRRLLFPVYKEFIVNEHVDDDLCFTATFVHVVS